MSSEQHQSQDTFLAMAAQNNEEAFVELYDRYFPKLHAYVQYKIYTNSTECEDITSEIMIKTSDNLDKFDPKKGHFAAWFFTLANNHIRDYLRKKKPTIVSLDDVEYHLSSKENVQKELEEKEQRKILSQALSKLPQQEQDIIALKYGSEYNSTEIANITGLSPENIRVIVFRTLQKIRKDLQKLAISQSMKEGAHRETAG
ncbi:MAG: sigma-70 family RNA polymerase sigma factor [bacterium]